LVRVARVRIVLSDPGSLPCAAVSTVVTVILLWTSWLITALVGAAGSPSLMTMMCRFPASLAPSRPFMAIWSDGPKSGMSLGVIRSMARSMPERLAPMGRTVKSHDSWPFQWSMPA
jgi:hypothetical protein